MSDGTITVRGALKIFGLPAEACFESWAEFLQALTQYTVLEIPESITNVVVSATEPSSSQRSDVWFRYNTAGEFIGIYLFTDGAWTQIYPVIPLPADQQVLISVSGNPVWLEPENVGSFLWLATNGPQWLTPGAAGSILTGGASPAWLAVGAAGSFLTGGTTPSWFAPGATGSLLIGGAAPAWIPPGSSSQHLIISGGVPVWQTIPPAIVLLGEWASDSVVTASSGFLTRNVGASPPVVLIALDDLVITGMTIATDANVLSGNITLTIYVNGIASAGDILLAGGSGAGEVFSTPVAVAAGGQIIIAYNNTATPTPMSIAASIYGFFA